MEPQEPFRSLIGLLATGGGIAALIGACIAVINARAAARKSRSQDDASLRTVTDKATADLIRLLRDQHRECQTRIAMLERRLDVFERSLPVIRMRDELMRDALSDAGKLPRLPGFDWDTFENDSRSDIQRQRDDQ